MRNLLTLLLTTICFTFFSCDKEEGEGGKATIKGKVFTYDVSDLTGDTLASYYALEERVYIIYGDNNIYDDDTRTHYDGSFQFQYLKKGDYTLYVYSDCDTCASNKTTVIKEVKIDDNKAMVEVPQFDIINLK